MNFILKLAYLYKVTEKKKLTSIVVIYCIMWLTRTSRKKKIDSSRICTSVYIISDLCTCILLSILLYGSVLWLTRPSRQR